MVVHLFQRVPMCKAVKDKIYEIMKTLDVEYVAIVR